jgi:hypothetical protein
LFPEIAKPAIQWLDTKPSKKFSKPRARLTEAAMSSHDEMPEPELWERSQSEDLVDRADSLMELANMALPLIFLSNLGKKQTRVLLTTVLAIASIASLNMRKLLSP